MHTPGIGYYFPYRKEEGFSNGWPLLREACRSNGSLNPFMKPSLGSTVMQMAGIEQIAKRFKAM